MRHLVIALSIFVFWTNGTGCLGQTHEPANLSGPTEIGVSRMPPGRYELTEQESGKRYWMTVTTKGTMILTPIKEPPAVSNVSGVAAAPNVVPNAPGVAPAAMPASPVAKSQMQQLMQKGMQQGVQQLLKRGGTGQLNKLLK
jgi:hypothetical protein